MNLEFDISFKDVKEGVEDKVVILATSKDLNAAMWIKGALDLQWASEENQKILVEDDPEREFFVQEREIEDE